LAWGIMTTTSHGCFVSFEKKKMTIRFFNLDQIRKFHLRQSNLQANYKNLCYLTTRHHLKMHCVWSLMGFWPRRIVSVSMTFLHHSGDCLKLSTKQFDLRRCRGYGDKLGFAPPLAPALQFAPQAWSPPLQTRCDMCCQSKVTFGSCTAPIWTPVWHGPLCDQNRQSASARIQSTGWKHVICKHFVCICTSMFQHGFWRDICGSALNLLNCAFCAVFAQWGPAKKLTKQPLHKSPTSSHSTNRMDQRTSIHFWVEKFPASSKCHWKDDVHWHWQHSKHCLPAAAENNIVIVTVFCEADIVVNFWWLMNHLN